MGHGLDMTVWLLFGALNWAILVWILLDINLKLLTHNTRSIGLISLTTVLLLLGLVQSMIQMITWFTNNQWGYALILCCIVLISTWINIDYIRQIRHKLTVQKEPSLFD